MKIEEIPETHPMFRNLQNQKILIGTKKEKTNLPSSKQLVCVDTFPLMLEFVFH